MPQRASSDATSEYPKISSAIADAVRRATNTDDEEGAVVALTDLIRALQAEAKLVTKQRDELLAPLLADTSNRQMAKRLGMSRQRVDQLAKAVAPGGRPIKRPARKGT